MEKQIITYPAMRVNTAWIDDRLLIDAEDLVVHLTNYFVTLYAAGTTERDFAIAAETIRNLALWLCEANDVALAENEKIFGQGLDNLLDSE